MIFRKKLEKLLEKEKVTLQKYRPYFTTTDGVRREGAKYNWAISERLRCSIPQYIMIDINSYGYIEDSNGTMYPLVNVVSIEWEVEEEMIVEDNFDKYQVFVTKKELEKYLKDKF